MLPDPLAPDPWPLRCPHRIHRPLLRLPRDPAAERRGLGRREAAVGREAAHVLAVAAREEVQVAFDVDDGDFVADKLWPADAALRELVLLPDRCAVAAIERLHDPLVIDDVEAIAIGGDA